MNQFILWNLVYDFNQNAKFVVIDFYYQFISNICWYLVTIKFNQLLM